MRTLWLPLLGLPVLLSSCHMRRLPDRQTEKMIDAARKAEIQAYPWPDYVTAEERNRIETALNTIFDVGGRDGRDAEAYIVRLDRDAEASAFRAVGRIVTEMKHVVDNYDLNEFEGKSRIRVLDRMLRAIDGVQERVFGEEYHLDVEESEARALRLVRVWNWWYREGRFIERHAPWDPRVDMVDPPDPDDKSLDLAD